MVISISPIAIIVVDQRINSILVQRELLCEVDRLKVRSQKERFEIVLTFVLSAGYQNISILLSVDIDVAEVAHVIYLSVIIFNFKIGFTSARLRIPFLQKFKPDEAFQPHPIEPDSVDPLFSAFTALPDLPK